MTHEIVMAGFGGQGVMLMGQLITYAGMLENKYVSWIPSYGPEMRGGTANCSVIVSEEPVGAPIVTEPTAVVAMNLPSLDKFEPLIKPGGILIINSSLIERGAKRSDVKAYQIPSNDVADELGNMKVANMVVLGAIIAATGAVSQESVMKAFAKMFAKKPGLLAINEKAIKRGAELIAGK
ncbi:MAG: 2-oxoacid:acceptor oxidoreductase family protein [Negativicutes bacterium]|nr:2-oxoacid:acceptor oxidoreductase family protein [Negativicutes bacterium]